MTSILGGAVLDLTGASIKKEATIDLFCLWGAVEIRVPEGVAVKDGTSSIMGGIENSVTSDGVGETSPTLRIVGDVVMSGVEIKRVGS